MNDQNKNANGVPKADEQLDAALEKWSKSVVSDPQSVELAKQKTLDAWQLEQQANVSLSSTSQRDTKSRQTLVRIATLAAAALVAAFFTAQYFRLDAIEIGQLNSTEPVEQETLSLVSLDADRQNEKLAHFTALFGDQLGSVAEFDDEVQIDLSEAGANDSNLQTGNFLAIKLVLLSRPAKSKLDSWEVEHRVHILARSQHRVDIRAGSSRCSLWAMPVDGDLITIDLNFELSGSHDVEFSSNALQRTLDPRHIHTTTQGGIEYRLYQTGGRLDLKTMDAASLGFVDTLCLADNRIGKLSP